MSCVEVLGYSLWEEASAVVEAALAAASVEVLAVVASAAAVAAHAGNQLVY